VEELDTIKGLAHPGRTVGLHKFHNRIPKFGVGFLGEAGVPFLPCGVDTRDRFLEVEAHNGFSRI
jgi:hypothetical protein